MLAPDFHGGRNDSSKWLQVHGVGPRSHGWHASPSRTTFSSGSPVFFADRLPPTLIVHTYADEVIPYNQATALDAAMTGAGVQHDLLLYEDTTHYLDAYNPTPATHVVFERILAFAKQYTRQ